jgi:hypothetical protein
MTQVKVPKEETGMVSDLRYGWKKLRKLGTEVSDNLARLQVRCSPVHAHATVLKSDLAWSNSPCH